MKKEEIENTVFEEEPEQEAPKEKKKKKKDKPEKEKVKKEKVKKEKKEKVKKEKPKKEKKEKQPKTAEQKAEIKKTVKACLLAAIAIAAVIYVSVYYMQTVRARNSTNTVKQEILKLEDIVLSSKSVITPYVPTDIKSLAYTVNTASEIKFFQFNGTEYTETAETGHIAVNIPLSNQQIPVDIHYVQRDGKLTGFGLFTASENDDVYIYDFMLCKITNLPKGYEKEGKCLLLATTSVTEAYALNPVWEEAYEMDLASGKMTRFLSEGNRMLDIKGAVRPDFCMLTQDSISSETGKIPFFSSRAYEITDENKKTDIYVKNGGEESAAVKDVADTYVKPTSDGGFVYIRKTEGGFNTEHYLNGKSAVIQEFFSGYGEQYVRSGDRILSKEDGRLYTTYDTTVIDLPEFKMNPNEITVSGDGKYVVMAGTGANVLDYKIYIYNTETGKCAVFTDSDYSVHSNLFFSSDTTVCFFTEDANGFNEKIIDVSKAV